MRHHKLRCSRAEGSPQRETTGRTEAGARGERSGTHGGSKPCRSILRAPQFLGHNACLHRTPAGTTELLVDEQTGPVHRGEVLDGAALSPFGKKFARRQPQQFEVDVS